MKMTFVQLLAILNCRKLDAKNDNVLRLQISFSKKVPVKIEECQQQLPECFLKFHQLREGRRAQAHTLHEEAMILMDKKKYEEAKVVLTKQAEVVPPWRRSVPLYNLACCEALLGNLDSALALLSQSIDMGFKDVKHIESDQDLISLHGLDAFEVMISELRKKKENPFCRWRGRCGFNQDTKSCSSEEIKSTKESVKPSEEIKINFSEKAKPCTQQEQTCTGCPLIPINIPTIIEALKPIIENFKPILENFKPIIENIIPIVENHINSENLTSPQAGNHDYRDELTALQQMGFTDFHQNLMALLKAKGNLSEAVSLLLR